MGYRVGTITFITDSLKVPEFSLKFSFFLKFPEFPCLETETVIFQVFPDFQSKWEPWINFFIN